MDWCEETNRPGGQQGRSSVGYRAAVVTEGLRRLLTDKGRQRNGPSGIGTCRAVLARQRQLQAGSVPRPSKLHCDCAVNPPHELALHSSQGQWERQRADRENRSWWCWCSI